MHVTQEMRQQACEGLLHFTPKKALARELGVSVGSIRDWAIYIQHGVFDWVDKPWVTRRPELLPSAVNYWFEHYPIGYSDVAKQFAVWRESGHIVPKDPPHSYKTPRAAAPQAHPILGRQTRNQPWNLQNGHRKTLRHSCRSSLNACRTEGSPQRDAGRTRPPDLCGIHSGGCH